MYLTKQVNQLHFLAKKLNDIRKNYTYDVEFYAIVQALCHWRNYLVPKEFVLFTYHIALKYANTQKRLNSRHAKWVSFLQGYTFFMKHTLGKKNQVADALSRHIILLNTMENKVNGFDVLKDLYVTYNDFWEMVEQLKNPVVGNMDLI